MGHEGHDMGGMSMAMTFHAGTDEVILFDFWDTTDNIGAFIGSLFVIFFMAVAYEALKYFREVLYKRSSEKIDSSTSPNASLLQNSKSRILNEMHGIQTVLHMLQFVLSYFLMLIFMTYNVWLAIAVTLGAGVGYFCFGWNKNIAIDVTDHCH